MGCVEECLFYARLLECAARIKRDGGFHDSQSQKFFQGRTRIKTRPSKKDTLQRALGRFNTQFSPQGLEKRDLKLRTTS